ncbi:probable leucine-rich repeat receptor-like protein kinase At5g63930 [Setaria italica]|nr:probable leucine-rich repeat receptor-like protein kinase At5g63930 [Setaria italica]
MGPQFPAWLRYQTGISNLNISNTRINDVLPQWFWVVFSNASILNLSKNQLSGALPATLELPLIREMDLSGNSLLGQLPVNLTAPGLRKLRLYNNHFTGAIPPYMCNNSFVEINLSNNQLGGDFPRCQESISSLSMLALKNNNLSGEFPHFLQNAAQLSFLDLSYNKFYGSVPSWIGRKMPGLQVLILRSNMFQGQLPKQSTRLVRLHFLDIAHNNISGRIPSSLAGLKAMTHPYGRGDNNYSSDTTSMFTKDRELNYTHKFMKRIMLIDLSCNGFTGHIPKEISLLKGLQSLNLSNNQISGRIPDDIGVLSELESLDLSYNHFTGEIPSSLSDLTFLSCLNLSYNDLSGRIPSGQQLQTLNNQYMYIGNPGLCGPPLLNNCSTNQTDLDVHQERESTIYDTLFFYLSISSGYLIGLWTVFCTLLFKKTWRIAYFRHFDQLYNKIYVQAALSKAAIIRKFQNQES